ncbi:MAG: type II secretion system protein GspE [Deltaproteobacteria bacterium HGW-Deltaproteobacteria-19]|jgi:general secretion pathway protein E|nr:MAG: type II secretion system protein GspE [Deltaproteobacteria bacterium HGW-Deltaproteobacteria-19]
MFMNEDDFPKVPFIMEGISSRFIRENRIIPLDFKNNVLRVVMERPKNMTVMNALRMAVAADIVVYEGNGGAIDDYLAKYYGYDTNDINTIIEDIDEEGFQVVNDEEDVGHLKDLASEAPIIKLVNVLLSRAIENRASDIHIEPFGDELKIRFRIDGVLHNVESVPAKLQPAIVSRIKILAKLNIAERRLPQDGRIKLRILDRDIDFRVSSIPVLYGESIVMRILDRENIVINLDELGFGTHTIEAFNKLITKPNGIILVTGPTGSGKTTTLYGALNKINSPDKKIITVEDPVEYQLKGINQIQVKPQIGLNFPNILRHIVRQDPDIIMIGEVRDLETAEIAIQSALTGHLVFSTLHTNDAPSAITRLVDIGVESYLLASTIRGILAQRLVRVICPSCKEKTVETTGVNPDLGNEITREQYEGKGCDKCAYTGYFGRTGIFELLYVDDAVRHSITRDLELNRLRKIAKENGMKTLLQDGAEKVVKGITTISELYRVTQEA